MPALQHLLVPYALSVMLERRYHNKQVSNDPKYTLGRCVGCHPTDGLLATVGQVLTLTHCQCHHGTVGGEQTRRNLARQVAASHIQQVQVLLQRSRCSVVSASVCMQASEARRPFTYGATVCTNQSPFANSTVCYRAT